MSDRGGTAHADQRWAAEQVVRQHENGRCKQCTDVVCPMLAWARGVFGDGPVGYPPITPAQPLLTG
jgi:hypothetical protein